LKKKKKNGREQKGGNIKPALGKNIPVAKEDLRSKGRKK